MSKERQEAQVLKYMLETGGITSWEAIREFGCTRLSARIYNLRKAGWVIDSEPVTTRNRWGDKVTFNRYFVVFAPQGDRA